MNKRIWLTGAARGIGLATARLLADTDAVLFLSSTKPESFKDVVTLFKDYSNIYFMPCDVSDANEVKKTYAKIKKSHGGIDILINNAGVGIFKDFADTEIEDFDKTVAVNFKGAFLCTKAVLPDMIKNNKQTMIINVSSVATQKVFPGSAVYSASKAALLTMSKVMREELRPHNVKVIDILPGATETDMWNDDIRKKYCKSMMKPDDVAQVILNTIELNENQRLLTEEIIIRPVGGDL